MVDDSLGLPLAAVPALRRCCCWAVTQVRLIMQSGPRFGAKKATPSDCARRKRRRLRDGAGAVSFNAGGIASRRRIVSPCVGWDWATWEVRFSAPKILGIRRRQSFQFRQIFLHPCQPLPVGHYNPINAYTVLIRLDGGRCVFRAVTYPILALAQMNFAATSPVHQLRAQNSGIRCFSYSSRVGKSLLEEWNSIDLRIFLVKTPFFSLET